MFKVNASKPFTGNFTWDVKLDSSQNSTARSEQINVCVVLVPNATEVDYNEETNQLSITVVKDSMGHSCKTADEADSQHSLRVYLADSNGDDANATAGTLLGEVIVEHKDANQTVFFDVPSSVPTGTQTFVVLACTEKVCNEGTTLEVTVGNYTLDTPTSLSVTSDGTVSWKYSKPEPLPTLPSSSSSSLSESSSSESVPGNNDVRQDDENPASSSSSSSLSSDSSSSSDEPVDKSVEATVYVSPTMDGPYEVACTAMGSTSCKLSGMHRYGTYYYYVAARKGAYSSSSKVAYYRLADPVAPDTVEVVWPPAGTVLYAAADNVELYYRAGSWGALGSEVTDPATLVYTVNGAQETTEQHATVSLAGVSGELAVTLVAKNEFDSSVATTAKYQL